MTINERLLEEIKRLGYKTKSWSEAVNISDKTQYTYEKGQRLPKTEYWQAAAKLGMDIQYVITGVHSNSTNEEIEDVNSENLLNTLEILLRQNQSHSEKIQKAIKIANEIAKRTG